MRKGFFAKAIVASALLGGMMLHAADTIKVGVLGLIKKNSGWIILFSYSSLSNHQQSLTSNF